MSGPDAPLDLSLLPRASSVLPDGRIAIGGLALDDLAEQFGTPLFVYDEEEIRERAREYAAQFGADCVTYAGKAFLCAAMVRLVDEEGLQLDVSTGGELHVARRAGFPPARIVMHGNNKSAEELRTALEVGVGRIVVDSFDEIDRIEALVGEGLEPPAVLVRVTPGVEAHTHEFVETGTEDSKFGFTVAGGAAAAAVARAEASTAMRLVGLHCHIGSQIFVLASYARAVAVVAEFAARMERETGARFDEFDLGGGLGIRYVPDDEAPPLAEYAAELATALEVACADAGLVSRPRLVVEPGRSIVGRAGVTVYRVGTVKRIPGGRVYVAVDGGMSDNARPSTYGARYEAFLPTRVEARRPLVASVAGKHCEQGDLLVRDARLPDGVEPGDLLATPATGAYGYSMASNYNKVPRPAVVFVRDGEARVVIRRETLDDLLRLDEA